VAIAISPEVLLSFIGGWFISQKEEEFRTGRRRLPRGASFRDRRKESEESESAVAGRRAAENDEQTPPGG
jgi:hypothetical protein